MERRGCVLFMYASATHMPMPCAMTVARAAPSMPQWKTAMNTKSRMTFSTVVSRMNSMGRTDSPTPRRMEMMLLKVTNRNVPPTYIRK